MGENHHVSAWSQYWRALGLPVDAGDRPISTKSLPCGLANLLDLADKCMWLMDAPRGFSQVAILTESMALCICEASAKAGLPFLLCQRVGDVSKIMKVYDFEQRYVTEEQKIWVCKKHLLCEAHLFLGATIRERNIPDNTLVKLLGAVTIRKFLDFKTVNENIIQNVLAALKDPQGDRAQSWSRQDRELQLRIQFFDLHMAILANPPKLRISPIKCRNRSKRT